MSELRLELPPEVSPADAQLLLAAKLFETGKLTLGQAAKLAGHSRRAFIEILGRLGVAAFNYTPEDLREETEL